MDGGPRAGADKTMRHVGRRAAPRGRTVRVLARIAGVSARTLHHHDAIGLLKPDHLGANGYRHYGPDELLRLQEILVLRELDMGLVEIARVLDLNGSDRATRLATHRDRLVADAAHRARLIATLERTIEHLQGRTNMTPEELYDGIAPERQADYEAWLIERYGDDMPARIENARRVGAAGPDGGAGLDSGVMAELARIEGEFVGAFDAGVAPGAPATIPHLEAHRVWVADRWGRDCDADAYAGLADLYRSHADFITRYEALAPGFSSYLPDAMYAHSRRISGND